MASTVTLSSYSSVGGDWSPTLRSLMQGMSLNGGGLILVPPGTYSMSSTVDVPRQIHVQGVDTMRWLSTTPSTTIFQASTGFSGTALFRFADPDATGYSYDPTGCSMRGLSLDGNSKTGSGINGLEFYGHTRDNYFSHINARSFSGAGVKVHKYSSNEAQELFFDWVYCYGNTLGFDLETPADSIFSHCMAAANSQDGWSINNSSNTNWISCGSEWNLRRGWHFHTANSGGQLVGCWTDRNNWDGVLVGPAASSAAITFVGMKTKRDGRNGGAGGGGYCGFKVEGTAGNYAPPVIVRGMGQEVGRDDDGGGAYSPQIGASVDYSDFVSLDGRFWGQASHIIDGGHTQADFSPGSVRTTGDPGSQVNAYKVVSAVDGTLQLRNANLRLMLDGATSLIVDYGGVIDFVERSDPSAPSSNVARLFSRDNGSGKTQLCVRFPTGAIQVLSTEP